jgi:hypothetical protein
MPVTIPTTVGCHHHLDTVDSTLRLTHMVPHLFLRKGLQLQLSVIFGTIA